MTKAGPFCGEGGYVHVPYLHVHVKYLVQVLYYYYHVAYLPSLPDTNA